MLFATVLFVITPKRFLESRTVNSVGGDAHLVLLKEQFAVDALVSLHVMSIVQKIISKNEVPLLSTVTKTAAS